MAIEGPIILNMRCLYCGKELALFKRLTGGEFCSDAHRLKYQEEYTQLALSRLLQANAKRDSDAQGSKSDTKAAEPKAEPQIDRIPPAPPVVVPAPLPQAQPLRTVASTQTPVVTPPAEPGLAPEPVSKVTAVLEPEPASAPAPASIEEQAPAAMAGLLIEFPAAAIIDTAAIAQPDVEFAFSAAPQFSSVRELPSGQVLPAEASLAAPFVRLPALEKNSQFPPRGRGIELREYLRPSPLTELKLSLAGNRALSNPKTPATLHFHPVRPDRTARLWQDGDRAFPVRAPESQTLNYSHTEWGQLKAAEETNDETGLAIEPPATVAEPGEQAPMQPNRPEPVQLGWQTPQPVQFEPVHIEPVFVERFAGPAAVAPIAYEGFTAPEPGPVRVRIIEEPQANPEPAAEFPKAPPIPEFATVKASAPPVASASVPRPVIKPVPVTLHGIAPGRGKVVHVFSAGLPPRPDMPGLRQGTLPLRPLMVLETVEPAIEKADGRKRKGEPKMVALNLARESGGTGKPAEIPTPQPAASKPDLLSLQKRNVEPPKSAWRLLPLPAWIGIVVAALAIAGGIVYLVSKRSSPVRPTESPVADINWVESGAALGPASGWITDWFVDVGPPPRHVDVLPSTLNLRDYRMELIGQIDRQALGWVFRANGRKNFYVEKIRITKPGLQPALALVRFAVIDGKEQPRGETPLTIRAGPETLYHVRLDAFSDRFVTWVQDEKVADWTDNRIASGGVGLYYEMGDVAKLKGSINLVPLKARN